MLWLSIGRFFNVVSKISDNCQALSVTVIASDPNDRKAHTKLIVGSAWEAI